MKDVASFKAGAVALTPGEIEWWKRFATQDEASELAPKDKKCREQCFDHFLAMVRRNNLTLGPVPRGLLPYAISGQQTLRNMVTCLERSSRKQDQLDVIGDIPPSMQQIEQAFGAGFPVADKNLFFRRHSC